MKNQSFHNLATFLCSIDLLTNHQASSAIDVQIKQQIPLVSAILKLGFIDESLLLNCLSDHFNLPTLEIDDIESISTIHATKPSTNSPYGRIINLKKGGLAIVIVDPLDLSTINDLNIAAQKNLPVFLVKASLIITLITKSSPKEIQSNLETSYTEDLDLNLIPQTEDEPVEFDSKNDAPIVKFINKIILNAIRTGASDIHFEPYEKSYRVRARIDGILQTINKPNACFASKITSRLKIMANLDIAERRSPQDGRFKIKLAANKNIDFRVNTCPTLYGEKIVLRILDSHKSQIGIDALGFNKQQRYDFLQAINKSCGMILATGPTGSGKTVTLYSALNILNKENINISSAEDPVEINLTGINQINVSSKIGFNDALRAFLRQDPDIIMVGEIRDLQTAQIAIKAAQTGHLVLSTLHTNSAADTLVRLKNIGIEAYNLASSIELIIAQRLVRKLCPYCKKPLLLPKSALLEQGFLESQITNLTIFDAIGCEKCINGYKDRIGIYEVMPINHNLKALIMNGANRLEIGTFAKENNIINLKEAGLEKVACGLTTLKELNRVIG